MIKNNFINIARSISYNRGRNKAFKGGMKNKPSSIWLFTDTHKTLNPTKLAEGLPQRSGIVIRHYNSTNKEAIIRGILNIKKEKSLLF